ncbi:MAG: hypothetical protein AB7Q29_17655 [Vicinamibacterales bacterium]
MAPSPLTFTLEFQGAGVHVPLLERMADALLNQLGCPASAAAEVSAALERGRASGVFAGTVRCDVRLRSNDRTLDILVSTDGEQVWQTSCALP